MSNDTTPEESSTEFVSATGGFRLHRPAAWVAEETFPGASIELANTARALDRHRTGEPTDADDLVIHVGFLPEDLMQQREVRPLGIRLDVSPDDLMKSMLPLFRVSADASLGEISLVSLDGHREAGMATIAGDESEGLILIFLAGKGVVALVSATTAPGATDRFKDVAFELAGSVAYDGDGQALYGALLSG